MADRRPGMMIPESDIPSSSKPAVLLIVFNRPAETRRVLERIVRFAPARIYVAADGPREHVPGDRERCAETRALFIRDGEPVLPGMRLLFHEENLGCGRAVSAALNWFFSQEDEGVVLEDDCLPVPGFFEYMAWALGRFRNNPAVWHVSGMGVENDAQAPAALACMPFIWGWASWKDRWKNYRFRLADSPDDVRRVVGAHVHTLEARAYWTEKFTAADRGLINTWDYQWVYALWKGRGLSLIPHRSWVENIGFTSAATHTFPGSELRFAPISTEPWSPPALDWQPSRDEALFARVQREVFDLRLSNPAYALQRLARLRFIAFILLGARNRVHRWKQHREQQRTR